LKISKSMAGSPAFPCDSSFALKQTPKANGTVETVHLGVRFLRTGANLTMDRLD